MTPKTCLACNKEIKGRTDKKFCDDYCRNVYNNNLKGETNNLIRNINNALRKNRRIMEDLLTVSTENMTKAPKEKLNGLGFSFKYFTHQYENKNKQVYKFCYEYGYLQLEGDWFLIVKRDEK